MNIRKLLDWRKLLIYSHRWPGIGIGARHHGRIAYQPPTTKEEAEQWTTNNAINSVNVIAPCSGWLIW